jgi:hypothetical protein
LSACANSIDVDNDATAVWIPLQATVTFTGSLATPVEMLLSVDAISTNVPSFSYSDYPGGDIALLNAGSWMCGDGNFGGSFSETMSPGESVVMPGIGYVPDVLTNADPTISQSEISAWTLNTWANAYGLGGTTTASGPGAASCSLDGQQSYTFFMFAPPSSTITDPEGEQSTCSKA